MPTHNATRPAGRGSERAAGISFHAGFGRLSSIRGAVDILDLVRLELRGLVDVIEVRSQREPSPFRSQVHYEPRREVCNPLREVGRQLKRDGEPIGKCADRRLDDRPLLHEFQHGRLAGFESFEQFREVLPGRRARISVRANYPGTHGAIHLIRKFRDLRPNSAPAVWAQPQAFGKFVNSHILSQDR
jgi:hypothetical protein